jgi:hypothetical protein
MGLLFTIAAGFAGAVIVTSESRGTRDHILISDSRFHQPGGPGPRIYIPPELFGPVIPPGTGFLFQRLLRLARLRWRYSTPPPHGIPVWCRRAVRFAAVQRSYYDTLRGNGSVNMFPRQRICKKQRRNCRKESIIWS